MLHIVGAVLIAIVVLWIIVCSLPKICKVVGAVFRLITRGCKALIGCFCCGTKSVFCLLCCPISGILILAAIIAVILYYFRKNSLGLWNTSTGASNTSPGSPATSTENLTTGENVITEMVWNKLTANSPNFKVFSSDVTLIFAKVGDFFFLNR